MQRNSRCSGLGAPSPLTIKHNGGHAGIRLSVYLNISWSFLYVGSSRVLADAQPASSQPPADPQSRVRPRSSASSSTDNSTPSDGCCAIRGVSPRVFAAPSPSSPGPGPGSQLPIPSPARGPRDSAKGGVGRDSAVQSSARMLVTMRLVEMMLVPPDGEEAPAADVVADAAWGGGGQTVTSSASSDDLPSCSCDCDAGCAAPAVLAGIRASGASGLGGEPTAVGDVMTMARHVGQVLLKPTSHCRMHLHA